MVSLMDVISLTVPAWASVTKMFPAGLIAQLVSRRSWVRMPLGLNFFRL